jgi:hypothetical protein
VEVFEQHIVAHSPDCVVTLLDRSNRTRSLRMDGAVVLEAGSPIVWFTFPGAWHDIGRFHTAAGEFTGIYANVLTPVEFRSDGSWSTTDLFLDLWQDRDGTVRLLDADELATAVSAGWIEPGLAAAAILEADRIVALAQQGAWPPPIVHEWTLARARATRSAG